MILNRLRRVAGGSLRARALLLLACVLALDTADVSMIGAIAGKLESALHLSNTDLGLLASVPSLVAAVATIPIGVLTDRVVRMRLLTASIVVWGIAMAASAAAPSFELLLLTRLALGAATATAGPTVSSLIGDYFPARERGRVYGLILSGELLGAAFGFVVAGEFATALSWRTAFLALALPSLALAYVLWRRLPEPARGGAGQLERGATELEDVEAEDEPPSEGEHEPTLAQRKIDEQKVRPIEELVLRRDPAGMPLWPAIRYVLRVRTNVILIIASALGYFYLTGVETFGLVYFRHHYGLGQTTATLLLGLLGVGALVGVQVGGRLADRLVGRGIVNARIGVGGFSFVLAALLLLPALLAGGLLATMPFFVIASAAFAARDPALDAARLDIMHHRLWGRAEAVRTLLRRVMVATAPLVFGLLGDALGSSRRAAGHGFGVHASAAGLHSAFLILVVTLLVGGLLTFGALRTYPRDVASAVASEQTTAAVAAG